MRTDFEPEFPCDLEREIGFLSTCNLFRNVTGFASRVLVFAYRMCGSSVGSSISALINDVLDLSKIEAGKMELESVTFNLRKEVDSVFTLFDEKLQQKKLEVFMLVHEAVPTCVVGDPGRFRQVLNFVDLLFFIFLRIYDLNEVSRKINC